MVADERQRLLESETGEQRVLLMSSPEGAAVGLAGTGERSTRR